MEIKARIPGKIAAINVKEGDAVKFRQTLGVLDAMKMEQPVPSPADGTVIKIPVEVGEKVKPGQVLFVVE